MSVRSPNKVSIVIVNGELEGMSVVTSQSGLGKAKHFVLWEMLFQLSDKNVLGDGWIDSVNH